MTEKTKAQRLADELDWQTHWKLHAAELRRMDANEVELVGTLFGILKAHSHCFPEGDPWGDAARALIARIEAERNEK